VEPWGIWLAAHVALQEALSKKNYLGAIYVVTN
jgi:hypothetical protein